MRKLRSTTRSIFPSGAFSCQTRSFTAPLATSFAVKLLLGAPITCFRKNSCPLALAEMALARQMNQTLGEFPSPSGSSMANRVSPLLRRDISQPRISSSVRAPAAFAASTSRRRAVVEMGSEGEPAEADRLGVHVGGVKRHLFAGFRLEVVDEAPVVSPLVGMDVPEARGVLEAGRLHPVLGHGDGGPGGERHHLLLADVMGEARPVAADASRQDEGGDGGPVDQVVVEPVVDAGAHDDHVPAAALLPVLGPFPGDLQHGPGGDTGEFLLPLRRERLLLVVVLRIVAAQAARDAELGHEEVEDGRDRHLAVPGRDPPDRDFPDHVPVRLETEADPAGFATEKGQAAIDVRAVDHVLHVQVPLPLRLAPAGAEASVGNLHLPLPVRHAEGPVGVLEPLGPLELVGPKELAWPQNSVLLRQFHEERKVGVLPRVLLEEGDLPVDVDTP